MASLDHFVRPIKDDGKKDRLRNDEVAELILVEIVQACGFVSE
jgi:hypothetical protein